MVNLDASGLGVVYRNGLARGGSEYGPLTDLPDWLYTGDI